MSNDMPRYVMRNCNAYLNEVDYIGQASEIQTPNITIEYEDFRNAGMAKQHPVMMGFSVEDADVKFTGLDPNVLPLIGNVVGEETPFLFTADLRGENGEKVSAAYYVRGHLSEIDFDNWQPGEKMSHGFMIKPVSGRLSIGSEEVLQFSPWELKRNGRLLFDARSALLAI